MRSWWRYNPFWAIILKVNSQGKPDSCPEPCFLLLEFLIILSLLIHYNPLSIIGTEADMLRRHLSGHYIIGFSLFLKIKSTKICISLCSVPYIYTIYIPIYMYHIYSQDCHMPEPLLFLGNNCYVLSNLFVLS